jgi:hypothetical protein
MDGRRGRPELRLPAGVGLPKVLMFAPTRILAIVMGAAAFAGACAPPPERRAEPTPRVRSAPAPAAPDAAATVTPPAPAGVTVDAAGKPQPHPLAPESVPDKPVTVPEDVQPPAGDRPPS